MSMREVRLCDLGKPCDTRSAGTCPLCGKDYCSTHAATDAIAVRIGLSATPGWRAGELDISTCRLCAEALTVVDKRRDKGYLAELLPTRERMVEALKALLAGETMKGDPA